MKQAKLYEKLSLSTVKCLACSWYCKISLGQTGICATRLNKKGLLYSLVYGKTIGLHLDPVEKKPLHHFLPGAKLLSFGTVGCNFGCLFCQNWDISQVNKNQRSKIKDQKLLDRGLIDLINSISVSITPGEIVEMASKEKAAGIAYTYNEPSIFAEFAHDTMKLAKKVGLKNIFVSNGFESVETFHYIKDLLDAINIDLKSIRNDFYLKICRAKIGPVLDNIKRFFKAGIETEITTLVIPGMNDSRQELKDLAEFLSGISEDIPWHISAFYPAYKMTNISPTPQQTLINAYELGKRAGLKYVYVGNIPDAEHSSTFCPQCGSLLIFREGYHVNIKGINLKKGCCQNCKTKIYGKWS